MKKNIVLLLLIMFSLGFSQIKVLKNESLILVGKENSLELYQKKNKYIFVYQDVNSSQLNIYRKFYFHDVNNDFETLYKIISDGFISMPSGEIQLELPKDIIGLNFAKNYGVTTVQFIQYFNKDKKSFGKSTFLNKEQVDRLFGKRRTKVNVIQTETALKKKTQQYTISASKD